MNSTYMRMSRKTDSAKFPPVMYGLRGICELFGVKKSTAMRYKDGILREAVTQNGRKIIIDTKKALELYGVEDTTNFLAEQDNEN